MPPQSGRQVICQGMVPAGGLYVPQTFPRLDWRTYQAYTYQELALELMALFLPDVERSYLAETAGVYAEPAFDSDNPAPLVRVGDVGILELWHGPTAAFKDMALQVLPRLMSYSMRLESPGQEILILTATSGDTGKAALEGFKDVPGVRIMVFYPDGGVSPVQERQMLTTAGKNTTVVAVNGNFDQCQSAVKDVFTAFASGRLAANKQTTLSSANSINWGRLLPQIVYYVWAYVNAVRQNMLASDALLNVVVPTGNFGNILAAYYAKRMGIPLGALICASNKNNVLSDFFTDGVYNSRRPFYLTMSPSMDILISSNLERFLFEMCGRDGARMQAWYAALSAEGTFRLDAETLAACRENIVAGWSNEEAVLAVIRQYYEQYHYVLDPHTAVAADVYENYRRESGDVRPTLLVSTASPYKFAHSVLTGMNGQASAGPWEALNQLEEITHWQIPANLRDLPAQAARERILCPAPEIEAFVARFLA